MDGRLLLFPHGQPKDAAARERCVELLLRAGGDLRRIIDGPRHPLAHFGRYVARVRGLAQEPAPPLVVLTETVPLAGAVLETRRRLEAMAPALQRASWIVFLDPVQDPGFESAAGHLGSLDVELDDVPIFTSREGARFLVLSRTVGDPKRVSEALRLFERQPPDDSGVVPRAPSTTPGDPLVERDTLRPRRAAP